MYCRLPIMSLHAFFNQSEIILGITFKIIVIKVKKIMIHDEIFNPNMLFM